MKPFLLVKAFPSHSHHHTKRATNHDFSLHRPQHHHHHRHSHHSPHSHTTAAGIAALVANASFAGNLTLPANAAFTRRQRLRWAQPHRHRNHLRRILPPTIPPTSPPTASAEIATITVNPVDVAIAAVSAELLLLGERNFYGRGRAEELPEGATAGIRRRAPDHYSLAEA